MKNIAKLGMMALAATMLVGCNGKIDENADKEVNNTAQVVNPFVEVQGTSDFNTKLGILVKEPARAEEITYGILAEKVAEMSFKLDDRNYTLRLSKEIKDKELHGNYGDFDMLARNESGEGFNLELQTGIEENAGGFTYAKYTKDGEDTIYLSLSTDTKVKEYDIATMLINVVYDMNDMLEGTK